MWEDLWLTLVKYVIAFSLYSGHYIEDWYSSLIGSYKHHSLVNSTGLCVEHKNNFSVIKHDNNNKKGLAWTLKTSSQLRYFAFKTCYGYPARLSSWMYKVDLGLRPTPFVSQLSPVNLGKLHAISWKWLQDCILILKDKLLTLCSTKGVVGDILFWIWLVCVSWICVWLL